MFNILTMAYDNSSYVLIKNSKRYDLPIKYNKNRRLKDFVSSDAYATDNNE